MLTSPLPPVDASYKAHLFSTHSAFAIQRWRLYSEFAPEKQRIKRNMRISIIRSATTNKIHSIYSTIRATVHDQHHWLDRWKQRRNRLGNCVAGFFSTHPFNAITPIKTIFWKHCAVQRVGRNVANWFDEVSKCVDSLQTKRGVSHRSNKQKDRSSYMVCMKTHPHSIGALFRSSCTDGPPTQSAIGAARPETDPGKHIYRTPCKHLAGRHHGPNKRVWKVDKV